MNLALMQHMKKSILRSLVMLITFCLAALPLLPAKSETEHLQTILIYITGSDLETESKAATRDITEMLRSRHDTSKTNVLIMIGGAVKWDRFPSNRSIIYEIIGNNPKEVYNGELMNMGDPDTLTFFMNYGYEHYPAKSYSLILWDHGGGPLEGVCYDEQFKVEKQQDSLSMQELQAAFKNSPFHEENKLEWIGFDACLMSSVETACICAPFAKYMIASQEVEPGNGWDYSFLKEIDDGLTGEQAGKIIVDRYYETTINNKNTANAKITLSCIDLSKMTFIKQEMDVVFSQLKQTITNGNYSILARNRQAASSVGRNERASSDYDLVDLVDLSIQLNTEFIDTTPLQNAIQNSIVYSRSNIGSLNGLSIYFPYYNQYYYQQSWGELYHSLSISDEYFSFLDAYSRIWLGDALSDWRDTKNVTLLEVDDTVTLSVELTEEQAANLASASLYVLVDQSENKYLFSSISNDVILNGTTLTAVDKEQTLVLCNSQGEPATGSIKYNIVDGNYVINATLFETDMVSYIFENDNSNIERVSITCAPPDENGYLEIMNITRRNTEEEALSLGKTELYLEDFQEILIAQDTLHPVRNENNRYLPVDQWATPGIYGWILSLEEEDHQIFPCMINRDDLGEQYVWLFSVQDTQGNTYVTEMITIENKNTMPLPLGGNVGIVLFNAGGCSAKLISAELLNGSVYNGVTLWFEVINTHEVVESEVISGTVIINDISLYDASLRFDFGIEKNVPSYYAMHISGEELARYGIHQIEEIVLSINDQYLFDDRLEVCKTETRLLLEPENYWNVSMFADYSENLMVLSPICSAENEAGVRFSLLKMQESAEVDGGLDLLMLVENNSSEEIYTGDYLRALIVNDIYFDATPNHLYVLPECKAVVEIKVSNPYNDRIFEYYAQGDRSDIPPRFDQAGINNIYSIRIVKIYSNRLFDNISQIDMGALLQLPEPFDYAAVRGYAIEPSIRATIRNNNCPSISIYHAEIKDNNLYLDVFFDGDGEYYYADFENYQINNIETNGSINGDAWGFSIYPFGAMPGCIIISLPEDQLKCSQLSVYMEHDNSEYDNFQLIRYPISFTIPIIPDMENQIIDVSKILVDYNQ